MEFCLSDFARWESDDKSGKMTIRRMLIGGAAVGAVIGVPVGFLIWLGAEHGGRGPVTMLLMAVFGAGVGLIAAGLIALLIRLLRRTVAR